MDFIKGLKKLISRGFNTSSEFYYVNMTCLILGLAGLLFAAVIFFATGFSGEIFLLRICLENSCIVRFSEEFSTVLTVIKSTGGIILGIFAIGSFGITCKNYIASKKAFSSNIHVSNVSVFLAYIEREIQKREKLKHSSFDSLKWYNSIFQESRNGVLEVSDTYIGLMDELSNLVARSNNLHYSPSSKSFQYKDHQTQMINFLSKIGITLHRMPRLDFHDVEEQTLDLIKVINQSFCFLTNEQLRPFPERLYR